MSHEPSAQATGQPAGEAGRPTVTPLAEPDLPLLEPPEAQELRSRWAAVQSMFVDDPDRAVREADRLVEDVTQAIASRFREHTGHLAQATRDNRGDRTEELRLAVHRYRSLFHRLLDA